MAFKHLDQLTTETVALSSDKLLGIRGTGIGSELLFTIDGIPNKVMSVAGRIGNITLSASDVAGIVSDVNSVNGKTGVVVLSASDIPNAETTTGSQLKADNALAVALSSSDPVGTATNLLSAHKLDITAHGKNLQTLVEFANRNSFSVLSGSNVTCVSLTSHDTTLTQTLPLTSLTPSFCNIIGGKTFRNFLSPTYIQITGPTHESGGNDYADGIGGGIEILTDGAVVELELNNYLSALGPWVSVSIDGAYEGMFYQDAATVGVVYMKFTHSGGIGLRRWSFNMGVNVGLWNAVHVLSSTSVYQSVAPRAKIVCIGDSIAEGYNSANNQRMFGYVHTFGRMLNADVINCSRTGTGYLEPGPSAGYKNYTDRWTRDIAGYHADAAVYWFQSSVNDAIGTLQPAVSAVTDAAVALWTAARIQSPNAHICVAAPVGYIATASVITLSAALKVAFDNWADSNSSWFDSRAVFKASNSTLYLQDGVVHPNNDGHIYLAGLVARHLIAKF